jgi:acetoin utilization deacetylase AcuC-like enzyme
MITKAPFLHTFYHPKMSVNPANLSGYTQSPSKPRLLMEYLKRKGLLEFFILDDDFPLLLREDFYVAHIKEMVDNFFDKGKTNKMLHIKWTPEYAETVKYGNAAMYAAIKYAVQNPEEISFNPFTGFHHANPTRSALFCAFSGQVIASVKVFYEFGLCGAYIDLDGHYGNSIDNSRDFVPDIDKAISPVCGNINIIARHQVYLEELKANLKILRKEILEERVHYIVFSHGADSHEWDELASQLSTEEWIESARLVYTFIRDLQNETKKQIPLIVTLCGGYRRDDYNSVLSLHTTDLVTCLNILCGHEINYETEVSPRITK